MKTAQAELQGKIRGNKYVRAKADNFDPRAWELARGALFRRNLKFAVAARSYRMLYEVTQGEVGEYFGVTNQAVSLWESGRYNWKGAHQELEEYQKAVKILSK